MNAVSILLGRIAEIEDTIHDAYKEFKQLRADGSRPVEEEAFKTVARQLIAKTRSLTNGRTA
jgi:hypothetical protein